MGEYIDVGIQNSILPLTIILSSLLLGIYALFGVETENDDDDSDSGSGGLMQPIWTFLNLFINHLFWISFINLKYPIKRTNHQNQRNKKRDKNKNY